MSPPAKARGWAAVLATLALATASLLVPQTGALGDDPAPPPGDDFRVGASKMVISGLTGKDDPTYPKLGEYDVEDLYMRAIVVENNGVRAALLSADLSGIDEGPWAAALPRVAALLGTDPTNVVMTSTHTHSDRPQGYDNNPGGGRYGAAQLGDWAIALIQEALTELEPAEMAYSTGELHLSVNRDVIDPVTNKWTQAGDFDGTTDPELNVLTFYRTSDATPIATYFAYPMHPVSGYLSNNTSGDFPAAASRYIEKAFGDEDTVALYNQGAAGDLNPRWLRPGTNVMASRSGLEVTGFEMNRESVEAPIRDGDVATTRPSEDVLRQLFAYQQSMGAIIGEEAIRVISTAGARDADPTIWSSSDLFTCPGRIRVDNAREGVPGVYTYDGAPDVTLRSGALVLGDTLIAGINAEVFVNIGLKVKAESPIANTMVVTVANGKSASGYVPDYLSESHLSFQVLGSRLKPGCAEGAIAYSLTALADSFLAGAPSGSNPTAAAPSPVIASVQQPTITGKAGVGTTLAAHAGKWSANGGTYRYQWLRDGGAIEGATDATYKTVDADAGTALSVVVIASKSGLADGAATSATLAVP